MPQSESITYIVKPPSAMEPALSALATGRRYYLDGPALSAAKAAHGVVGGYRIGGECAEIVPLDTSATDAAVCYFWDADCDVSRLQGAVRPLPHSPSLSLPECRLRSNRLTLKRAALEGPELSQIDNNAELSLSPRFDFTFSTDAYAAQLGVIQLVQAKRFIDFENGDTRTLLDSGDEDEPVLYRDPGSDDRPIKCLSAYQEAGRSRPYAFTTDIRQHIPERVGGKEVVSLTVLEYYSTYLMQCAVAEDVDQAIWTPLYPVISWGWSIRVGRRSDGDWAIMRRKLMLPTTGHDGLQLPLWRNHSLACSFTLNDGA